MIYGIDLDALAKPMVDLLDSFGSGALPGGGPADALRQTSNSLDGIHQAGKSSIDQMSNAWNGGAGDAAMDKAMKVQTTAADISDRGNNMADVMTQAATTIQTGQRKLAGILQDFVHQVNVMGPAATTPAGLGVVVGSAINHIGQAVTVVGQTRSELDTHTTAMTQLIPPPSSPAPAGVPSPAGPGLQQVGTILSGLAGTGGSMLGGATTSPASMVSPTQPGTTGNPSNGKPGKDGGVEITLPDGSRVMAPNQKAATAVKAALSARGTPYVWGGNTPGKGLDCSGLTKWAYSQAGVDLPRLACDQSQGAMPVSAGDVEPGDLAIWDGHVAMVVGNGEMVEAGDPVQVDPIRTENMGMRFHGFFRPTS